MVNYSGIFLFSQRTFITLCNSYCDGLLINGLFFYTNPGNLIIQVVEASVHYFFLMMISKLRTGRNSETFHFWVFFFFILFFFFFLLYIILFFFPGLWTLIMYNYHITSLTITITRNIEYNLYFILSL